MLKVDRQTITYLMLFITLPILFFASGGLLVTLMEERVQPATPLLLTLGLVIAVTGCLALCCSRSLLPRGGADGDDAGVRKQRKHFVFSLVLFTVIVASTLVLGNVVASFYTVSWPMSGLHGVSPAVGEKAWGYHEKGERFVTVNSWGQRDREHPVKPAPGTFRTIFIGDSFLEDGAPVPLPFRTEEVLRGMGQTSHDVVNLGVSATDPDEYFFRLKRVGLPLQPNHCVLMFSAGSDFIQEPSLTSLGGIAAPYPRWSFLQGIGLKALDQVISNDRRPLLRAWFKGGALLKHELELKELFGKTRSDQETEAALLDFFPAEQQLRMKAHLHASSPAELSRFYEMLRHPDDGKFRSYYLDIASRQAMGQPAPEFTPAEYSFRWVKAAFDLCRSKGVKFTLVLIPDGFTVDARMAGQWLPLADMRAYMKHKDDAADRLVSHAVAEGMTVVDLRELLRNAPGAYLNLDGHWSQKGVDLVAAYLAGKLGQDGVGGGGRR